MMKPTKYLFFLIIFLLYNCKPQIPDEYLQPDELEDILYDYHIADAMAEEVHDEENVQYKKILYRQAVLKKHGVTQAEFDTTLVYYTRHADKLHNIYENLTRRLSDEALALGASVNDINKYGSITSNGDTTDVWKGEKSIILTSDAPYNVMSFDITTDTTYHKGDRMILGFNSDFIFKDGIKDAIAMLAVCFKNDSVTNNTLHISSNSKYTATIFDNDEIGIKSIKGFFYLPKSNNGNNINLRLLSITNISLVRFHETSKPKANKTDTLKHTNNNDTTHNIVNLPNNKNVQENPVAPNGKVLDLPNNPPMQQEKQILMQGKPNVLPPKTVKPSSPKRRINNKE